MTLKLVVDVHEVLFFKPFFQAERAKSVRERYALVLVTCYMLYATVRSRCLCNGRWLKCSKFEIETVNLKHANSLMDELNEK